MIGAVIDLVDRAVLQPGDEGVTVRLRFWTDAAAVYATPGTWLSCGAAAASVRVWLKD
jgi:hypothetical protein